LLVAVAHHQNLLSAAASTFYQILNISMNAAEEEIKKSYRRLALIYHPDKHKLNVCNEGDDEAEETCMANAIEVFLQIQLAYETLSNVEKRKQYDLSLDGVHYDILSEDDDNDDDVSYQSSPFNLFVKTPRMKLHFTADFPKKKINDLIINISVDLIHTLTGYEKSHVYYRKTVCAVCGGNGGLNGKCEQCSHCRGTGIGK